MKEFIWQLRRDGDPEVIDQFTSTISKAISTLSGKGFTLTGSVWHHASGLSIRSATIVELHRLDVEDYKT